MFWANSGKFRWQWESVNIKRSDAIGQSKE
jgi:hypothetical protein